MRPHEPWPGNPDTVWDAAAAAVPADVPLRPAAPDITGFDEFARRAAPSEPGLLTALLLAFTGVGAAVCAAFLFALAPEADTVPEGLSGVEALFVFFARWHWVLAAAVAAWCLVQAPRVYRKDRRDHPGEVRELYAASRDRGVLCETSATSFKVPGSDGWNPTVIGVDARLDATAAARIRRAFKDWFAVLAADKQARKAAADRHRGRLVLPAVDVFGPEAEGGYLITGSHLHGKWTLLIPDAKAAPSKWDRLWLRDPN